MNRAKSRLGQRFDSLTITEDDGLPMVLCACDCGRSIKVLRKHLRIGVVRSCGCVQPTGNDRKVNLSKGRTAIVDASDFDDLTQFGWVFHTTGYAVRRIKLPDGSSANERMHRRIMGLSADDPRVVDHIDGDPLNNRRSNLRICTRPENMRNSKLKITNTSGLKGVSWAKPKNTWQATIRCDGKQRFLGYFDTKEDAHAAYCKASRELHGEFSNTSGHSTRAEEGVASC